MRCDICKYSKNDSCSLSLLIKEEEQFENEEGIGCKYNNSSSSYSRSRSWIISNEE